MKKRGDSRARGLRRTRYLLGLALWAGAAGCGGTQPPAQLPSSGALVRAASRVELVDLVIGDRARAKKVRDLYVEIEQLMLDTKRTQAAEFASLANAGSPPTDAVTREAFKRFQVAELGALRRHASLQMELRRATTPEEFARLDAIK